ncbi:MAG: nucleotidyltransferase domain-containing protein [Promethearchaeia archaeon]
MCKICSENNFPNWKNFRKKLKEFIHQIDANFDIIRIILFGSFANGDYHENSDIDLIIIGNFTGRIFDRIGNILDFVPKGLQIEPFVYSESEFEYMINSNNPFILNALRNGVDLLINETS